MTTDETDTTPCDHCGKPLHREAAIYGGWWVGEDRTAECDANPNGHEVDGRQR